MNTFQLVSIPVPKTAAGTVSAGMLAWSLPQGGIIDTSYGIKWNPDTSVTANDTNYSTYTLTRYRAASGTTLAARPTTVAGTGFTAYTPTAMTVDAGATGKNLEVATGDLLVIGKAESGSGQAGGGCVSFRVILRRD